MTELRQRILVSVVFIPVLLSALWLGGIPLIIMFAMINVLGGLELIMMLRNKAIKVSFNLLIPSFLLYIMLVLVRGLDAVLVWTALLLLIIGGILNWDRERTVPGIMGALFCLVYVSFIPALIVRIGLDYIGQPILLSLVIAIWIVDSVAYFVGMSFGKHRNLTPISPRKSLEGFVAGALVPFVIVIIFYYTGFKPIAMPYMLMVASAAGIVGQMGDLAESMLKRFADVKDSSRIIPGHGGILDRTDSILLAGSYLYCVLMIFEKVR